MELFTNNSNEPPWVPKLRSLVLLVLLLQQRCPLASCGSLVSSSCSILKTQQQRASSLVFQNSWFLTKTLTLSGGASEEEYDEYDGDDDEEQVYDPRQRQRRPPSPAGHPERPQPPKHETTTTSKKKKQLSLLSQVASKSFSLTSKVVSATASTSGKAAYYLVKPKHVEREELFGFWIMDQQLESTGETCSCNFELTPQGRILVGDDRASSSPWKFTPDAWPKQAKVEFMARAFAFNDNDNAGQLPPPRFLYKAVVHRKLAASNVIQLRGKIYRMEKTGWRGKTVQPVCIGTFIARRRLKLQDDEDDDFWSDDEEEDFEHEEYSDHDNNLQEEYDYEDE